MIIASYLCVFLLGQTGALPNFVFVLTDDQDLVLRSLDFMNRTTSLVANKGLTFTNFFVNSPVCCPSRSSILTGKYAHNCRVFNNSHDGGCSGSEWQQKYEHLTIASALKSKNYKTFYAGKYLNQYGTKASGGVEHVPPGYDWWIGLEGNSKYYNYTLSINGSAHFFRNVYLTDKITEFARDFLNVQRQNNFFVMLAPPACHAPFVPAPRHANLFPSLKTCRKVPFNYTPVDKHWLVQMAPTKLPQDVSYLDEIYRNRIRTLQAVDEMIETIVNELEEIGVLDNTYIIFTSDNGFHIGQFTQPWDKRQPYESDIRVPLLVRGPKIQHKVMTDFPVSAVDLFPTILDLADIPADNSDGNSFKNILFKSHDFTYRKFILVEYWGEGDFRSIDPKCPWGPDSELSECASEAWCKCQDSKNNTYSCVLELSNTVKFKFCMFEKGFIEAYDLMNDPYELHNLKLDLKKINYYVDILQKLQKCNGLNCKIKF